MSIFLAIWNFLCGLWAPLLWLFDKGADLLGKGFSWLLVAIMGLFPSVDLSRQDFKQIPDSIAYAPWYAVSAFFRDQRATPEVNAVKANLGGFARGICHSGSDFGRLLENNINWERLDCPFPFPTPGKPESEDPLTTRDDGTVVRTGYENYKNNLIARQAAGLKNMVITPFPRDFIGGGVDPRTPEGEVKLAETIKFIFNDLKPYTGAVQISNEIGVPNFQRPLTNEEGVRFLAVQLEALAPLKGNIPVGYNTAGPQFDINSLMKPYLKYVDFYGMDIYLGCHVGLGSFNFIIGMYVFDIITMLMWGYLGKPIIVTEFGYLSAGVPKTQAEKDTMLRERYGYNSEAEMIAAAKADPEAFLTKMESRNPSMAGFIRRFNSEDLSRVSGFLTSLECVTHLYCELPADYVIPGFPHTPQGEADFYADILPRFAKHPYVLGTFVYNWKDSTQCYLCGQHDCPSETGWGLVDWQGNPKPALAAVRDAYAKLK
ncbi:MAG: hypothetical protein FWC27_13185 [Firmicutes bacterium]|nr:hypothetical protein [Bacillota bacterium]